MASEILWMMILAMILLGMDRSVIPHLCINFEKLCIQVVTSVSFPIFQTLYSRYYLGGYQHHIQHGFAPYQITLIWLY